MDGSDRSSKNPKKSYGLGFRSHHRDRSHESAHADPALDAAEQTAPPDIPLVFRGPPEIVISQDQLLRLIGELRDDKVFAYDSEFIGELTYHPQLCLVQAASQNRVALVDPLAELDLTPFWELLADPAIEKIVHAGEQDIEPVVRHLHRPAANVFDTQVAAGFVGLPYPMSLSKLVAEMTGARLGKGFTFSHWDQRPLSAVQLRYAADDVRYLPAAAAELMRRLDAFGHAAWARQECAAACAADRFGFDPETQYLRVRGSTSLAPKNLAVLRQLTIWRDAAAREHDMPPRAFVRDEVLIDLSRDPVKSVDRLAKVRGLPRPVEDRYGADIVEITARALTLPGVQLPNSRENEPSPADKFRADSVFAAAQCFSAGMGLDPALVASRQDVMDFYRSLSHPNSTDPPQLLQGWRKEAVGDLLVEFLKGKRTVELNWTGNMLRAQTRSS